VANKNSITYNFTTITKESDASCHFNIIVFAEHNASSSSIWKAEVFTYKNKFYILSQEKVHGSSDTTGSFSISNKTLTFKASQSIPNMFMTIDYNFNGAAW
jgi:hypothetical protein